MHSFLSYLTIYFTYFATFEHVYFFYYHWENIGTFLFINVSKFVLGAWLTNFSPHSKSVARDLQISTRNLQVSAPNPQVSASCPASLCPQPASVSPQPASLCLLSASVGPQPASLGLLSASLGPQPASLCPQPASLCPQPASLCPQPASLGRNMQTVSYIVNLFPKYSSLHSISHRSISMLLHLPITGEHMDVITPVWGRYQLESDTSLLLKQLHGSFY